MSKIRDINKKILLENNMEQPKKKQMKTTLKKNQVSFKFF